MNSILILFSVIVLASAKPADYGTDQIDDDGSTSVSDGSTDVSDDESDERSSIPESYPVSVFTKYPDDPNDSYRVPDDGEVPPPEDSRKRRQTGCNENDSSIDINKQADKTDDVKRSGRKTEDHPKVPLRGLITAIESDLVSKALDVNSQLRRRRSTERIADDDDDSSSSSSSSSSSEEDENNKQNQNNNSTVEDSVDVNKNFFEGLFNYTRPLRETEEKDVKIPLNGLVSAVETTLINSEKILKDSKNTKREASTKESHDQSTEPNESHRIFRDTTSDQETKEPEIKVAKIGATNNVNLNLLSSIAAPAAAAPSVTTEEPIHSGEEGISTTEIPFQSTNITLIQASGSVSLVPGADKKLAHVQHQEILKTVFHSSLAIFPTIPPQSINAPLPHFTTTEESIETTVTPKAITSTTSKSEEELKHEQLLQKAQKLKEKFAEIQAEPVILSQF